jgi:bifunctional non-homologous end joining protein LigD
MMLACRGKVEEVERLQQQGFLFDLKIDGVRCMATVEHGDVRLVSRQGIDMTSRYPEVVAGLKDACPSGRLVLDGEIAVVDDKGLPSWPLTHKRDAQQSRIAQWAERMPAKLFVFDMLEVNATDMRGWAYANRRQVLDQEAAEWTGDALQPTLFTADGQALWSVVCEHQLEGMIAKRANAPYRTGRSQDWVKIKRTSTVSCLVGGTDPGTGARASTFGNLHLYLLDGDHTLVPVGKVGSGFSDKELHKMMQALHHPPVIVEVEYLDCSPDGQLRQPVFQRIRTDLAVTDCTTDQLLGGGPR